MGWEQEKSPACRGKWPRTGTLGGCEADRAHPISGCGAGPLLPGEMVPTPQRREGLSEGCRLPGEEQEELSREEDGVAGELPSPAPACPADTLGCDGRGGEGALGGRAWWPC